MINEISFDLLIRQKEIQIFAIFLKDIDIELTKKKKSITNLKTKVSLKYHDFLDVFFKQLVDVLSSHEKHDHTIELKLETQESNYVSLYNMFEDELLLMKKYLKENLKKDFLKTSSVFFASLILFAKKLDEEIRLCMNYRKLNVIIKKNRYLISLINELITRLARAKFMTKRDIRHAFNEIRMMIEKDENLIIFRIRFDFYKYLILSFDLINDSITFQNFINDTFMKYLNEFVVIYLDDILIYNQNMSEHRKHVRKVLQKLRDVDIQVDINKCEFHVTKIKFLEVIINQDDIRMHSKKIRVIQE
jgi:hypothetical protein